ncbi:MAG: PilZ domain-containing protein [Magnetococcus sp. DMHC-8]
MNEMSIFQKEEELLAFGQRFLEEYGPESTTAGRGPDGLFMDGAHLERFYDAFQQVFTNYKKLFQQTTRLIRLSDRTQLRLDTVNRSLRESQLQLERRNQFIRGIFGRYMSDEVVESILETPDGLQMGGEKRQVTVMMSDLRGFTAISEHLPAEQVVAIVNHYLEIMTEIIFKHKGTISNFMGDGIMILFGAPISRADDPQRAVACALEMQKAMPGINADNQKQGLPTLTMGIGIHTGSVVAGNIGSQKRSQYTVMGRTVNLAARIESCSVGGQVLVSDRTRQACHPLLRIDNSMEITPKGVDHAITVYQVGGIGGQYAVHLEDATVVHYQEVDGGLPVQFAILTGKQTGATEHAGVFCSLSANGAKLVTEAAIPPLTNLMLTVQRDDESIRGVLAKVTGGETDGRSPLELVFTFVPPRAQAVFQTFLAEDGWNGAWEAGQASSVPVGADTPVIPTVGAGGVGRESRISLRRVSSRAVPVPVEMGDGSRLRARVGDFSLDGMLLKTGRQKRPEQGAKGSLVLELHGQPCRFEFEVVHLYQRGIGIRILADRNLYAMALLDGALGNLLAEDPPGAFFESD